MYLLENWIKNTSNDSRKLRTGKLLPVILCFLGFHIKIRGNSPQDLPRIRPRLWKNLALIQRMVTYTHQLLMRSVCADLEKDVEFCLQ